MPRKKDKQPFKAEDRGHPQPVPVDSARFTGYATEAVLAAVQLGIEKKPLKHFWLSPAQRELIRLVPGVTTSIKTRLAKDDSSFTVTDVAHMMIAVVEDIPGSGGQEESGHLLVAQHLLEAFKKASLGERKSRRPKPPPSTSSRSRCWASSRRSGGESRSGTARSTSSTSTSRRRWAGRTRTCTPSRLANSLTATRS